VEGAAKEGGRGPSTNFLIFQEDIQIMKNLNMDAYRFSISWSHLIPGKVIHHAEFTLGKYGCHHLGVTQIINFYVVSNKQNIEPYVTIYHWDLPQALEESMGGSLNSDI
ncbi:unnamed protein product, partial [Sphagnum compactum]